MILIPASLKITIYDIEDIRTPQACCFFQTVEKGKFLLRDLLSQWTQCVMTVWKILCRMKNRILNKKIIWK